MVFGLIGAIGLGLWLSPIDPELKLWFLFGLCLACFCIPALALCVLFSNQVWFVKSGAQDMLLKSSIQE